MTDNQINIDHLAQLAKLNIKENEKEKLANQLKATVDYIEILQQLDTSKVTETSQVTGLYNIADQDKAKSTFSQKDALSNAPKKKDGYFVVEKIKWNE